MIPQPSEPGTIVAFYSYKGGTGRSMALANTGVILARDTTDIRPVLMIDWDLEAPGLHRYFRKHLFRAFRESEAVQDASPGLIDLFLKLQERLDELGPESACDFSSAAALITNLPMNEYVIETDIANLHLLKAGCFDSAYAAKVGSFQWPALYRSSPFLLRAFAERLARDYRYVLIDSRTGLTDTSGICAMLMPEILVTVFTPNRQSVSGVIDLIREAGRYRSQSEDLRPLLVFPLPSRVEASEPSLRSQWRFGDTRAGIEGFQPAFERVFREIYDLPECDLGPYFDDVQVQHASRYAYGEEVAVLIEETRDRLSLTRSYQQFAARLAERQLPWTSSSAVEVWATSEVELSAKSEGKDRATVSYLQRVYDAVDRLGGEARLWEYLGVACAVALLSPLVALFYPVFLVWALALVVVSIPGAFLSTRNSVKRMQAVRGLERELNDFKTASPPYETDDALQRLITRTEPILRNATAGAKTKPGKTIISYRRQDASAPAGRIYDTLLKSVGSENVFMDIASIAPGEDFVKAIDRTISSADTLLVVMGPQWLAGLSDDSRNVVRLELGLALSKNLRVIPVLVDGAKMPRPDELPEDIKGLADRNAFELSATRWQADMLRLTEVIATTAGKTPR